MIRLLTPVCLGVGLCAMLGLHLDAQARIRFLTVPAGGGSLAISGVSGTLSHGSSVTVSGSGFSTKALSAPYKWDTMNGTVGDHLEPRGWLVHTNTPQPLLSAAVVRSTPSRTTSAAFGQTGANVPGFSFGDNGGTYLDLTSGSTANLSTPPLTLLIDYWIYFVNATTANNYKFWRWHPFNNPASNNYWGMADGSVAVESSELGYFNGIGVSTINNVWTHHRLYLHPSPTQSLYFFQHVIDNHLYASSDGSGNYVAPDGGFTEGPWPVLVSGDRLSTFQFEMQDDTAGSGSRDAKQYLCDLAVDDGYGAVYIGDASTWAATTHTEYQPYTSWAAGSIVITLNRGTFSSGATVYVYVVTDARLVSAGRAITLA